MNVALPALSRWQSADLAVKSASVLQGLTGPAPNLKYLTIQASQTTKSTVSLPMLFGGQAPRLQALCLSNVVVAGVAALVSGLHELEISTPSIVTTWPHIHALVSTSSQLKHLALRFKMHRDVADPSRDQPLPVALPRLDTLQLSLDPSTLQSLLLNLTAPLSERVQLESSLEGVTATGHIFDLLHPLVRSSRSIRINIGEGGLLLRNPDQSLSLFLGEREGGGVDQGAVGAVFEGLVQRMPEETRVVLSLGPDTQLQQRVFAFLSNRQRRPESSTTTWPLPHLGVLTLETADRGAPLGALKALASARSQDIGIAAGEAEMNVPSKLIAIHCRGRAWGFEDLTTQVFDGREAATGD